MSWAVFLLFAFLLVSKWLLRSGTRPKNLAPGPPALPIIGHLHLLRWRQPMHHSLAKLARRYGAVYFLRFGYRPVLVVSSPSAAEECFTRNDVVFANRPRLHDSKYLHYDNTTLATAPYGPYWRNLRRLTTIHIFSTNSASSFAGAREEKVTALLLQLLGRGPDVGFRKVQMRTKFHELAYEVTMTMISRKSADDAGEGERVRQVVEDIIHFSGVSSLDDFIPGLSWVDVTGRKGRMMRLRRRMDSLFQGFIDAHREMEPEQEGTKKTIIDVLLGLQDEQGEHYTDELIKGVIQVLIIAGIDTASATMEWSMALLLNHPETLKKARDEIDAVTNGDRLLGPSDLPNLPHLHGVIKETLRLYPVAPLLVPHQSSAECTVEGYDVPPGTMLLVNAYAIQRDPTLWTAPEEFKPERFEGGDREGYRMIPFGSGRRRCPGEGIAMSLMPLALGSLIQCFEWKTVSNETVDMAEAKGTTLHMAKPLEALCRPRRALLSVLSQL